MQTPRPGSDKIFLYSVLDHSDGNNKVEVFAIRFRDADSASQFREAFEKAKTDNAGKMNASAVPSPAVAAAGGGGGGGEAAPSGTPSQPEPVPEPAGPPQEIPQATELSEIYGADKAAEAETRFEAITARFGELFDGAAPTFFVRAPGRVNLIGEHVDYHHYPVCPFALEHDVVIAGCATEPGDAVHVANMDVERYPQATFASDPDAEVLGEEGGAQWHHYVQCGFKGAFEAMESRPDAPVGMQLLVDGRVPQAAGLSSSSALVVASVLATLQANDRVVSAQKLSAAATNCERHIGTLSGGMDQAIASLAKAGEASVIEFAPRLAVRHVRLPADAAFIVADSGVRSAKAEDAALRYNRRVIEGKLAAKLVAKKAGVADWRNIRTLHQLQGSIFGVSTPTDLLAKIDEHLKQEPYSGEELEGDENFGVALPELFAGEAHGSGWNAALAEVAGTEQVLQLHRRARHVASEAARVDSFRRACEDGSGVARLGELMNESQASCKDDYECSTEELDQMVGIAREAGAAGARLTGAGWGGCIVALAAVDKVEDVLAALRSRYFEAKVRSSWH